MCGFLAVIGNNLPSEEKLKKSLNYQKHRGPDNTKYFSSHNIWFGFNRLKIIDITDLANMPLSYGPITIMLNGQILNFIEIKKTLIEKSAIFNTVGDSEVLAASIYYYGIEKTINLIEGMWSFIAHDKRDNSIIISRDPFGKKPLWQSKINDCYAFSTEIKSILKLFPNTKDLNYKVIFDFINSSLLDVSNESFFKHINRFPQNSYAILRNKKIDYYNIKTINNIKSITPKAKDLKNLIDNSIKQEIQSDVPVALTLSGGVDSSYLAKISNNEKDIKSYTISNNVASNEKKIINEFTKSLNLKHEFVDTCNVENIETIDTLLNYFDQPFKSSQTIFQYALRKKISMDGYKVLLTGDGADELFSGYKILVYPFLTTILFSKNFPYFLSSLKSLQFFLGIKKVKILNNLIKFIFTNVSKNTSISNYISSYFNNNQSFDDLRDYNIKLQLLKRIFLFPLPYWLRIEDSLSMMCSLENRTPYLNYKILNYMINVDPLYYMKNTNKYLMKKAIFEDLPKSIIQNKIKYQKPTNTSGLIFKSLFKDAKDIFNSSNFEYIIDKKISVNDFIKDSKKNINSVYWFKLLILTRWLESTRSY